MKIAVVCDILGGENNGTAVATMDLVRYLRSRGHEVRLICSDEDRKDEEDTYVMPSFKLCGPLKKIVDNVGVKLPKYNEKLMNEYLDGVEYVHCTMPFTLSRHAALYAAEHCIPVSAGMHLQAENITAYFGLHRSRLASKIVYKALYKRFFSFVNGIHYPTEFMRETFERNVKAATRGRVISNGVNAQFKKTDCQKPAEFEGEIVILSIGRYSFEKSQDTLLKAVALSRYRDRIRVILAGEGIREREYEKLARKLPVKPVMKVFSRDEMVQIINYCDMVVHPAVVELEGIACLEAIKCGKLLLVSDSELSATQSYAVCPECVFKHRDPKDLAKWIDYWIEHPEAKAKAEEKMLNTSYVKSVEECMRLTEQFILDIAKSGEVKTPTKT